MLEKTSISKVLSICALLLLSGVFVGQASAQSKPPFDALEGLDPVMLVQGREVQGEMNLTVTRGQFRYYFANAANKATFDQDPTRYEIQANGECSRMGAPVYGTPDLYSVYQGRIYIFGSGECKKRFDAAPEKYFPSKSEANTKAALTPEALQNGAQQVNEVIRLDQEREIRRRPLSILRARKSANFKPAAVGGGKVGEAAVEQVAIALDGTNYMLGIDPATGRLLSLEYERRGPEGNFGQFVQEFSDFRTVDGLTLPFKTAGAFNGQPWKEQSSTVEAITLNGKVDPALFEKPQPNKPQQ
jgi:YHS domain-containing protein